MSTSEGSCEFKVPDFTDGKMITQSRRSTPLKSQPFIVALDQIGSLTAFDNGIVGGHARHLGTARVKYRSYVKFSTTSQSCCNFLSEANHQLHCWNDSSSVCLACCFTIWCLSPTLIFSPKGQFRRLRASDGCRKIATADKISYIILPTYQESEATEGCGSCAGRRT